MKTFSVAKSKSIFARKSLLLQTNSKTTFLIPNHHHHVGKINVTSFWREFSSILNQHKLEKSTTVDDASEKIVAREEEDGLKSSEDVGEEGLDELLAASPQEFQVTRKGFITSMNILEFTDDSEWEECNGIISSCLNDRENVVVGCNALLKRIYIEIYFMRDYEKARQDIVLVRNVVGEQITEELNRFLSQLNSYISIEILNEKIGVASTEGNVNLLIPLIEKRCLELANVGKYKQSLEDLDYNIQTIEKLVKSETEEKTKLETQLLNMYKQRMSLFKNFKLEMERLLDVGRELSSISHDSSQEMIHFYFTTTSLNDPRHTLNGGNMDLIREIENIFLKEEEKAHLWDISHARTFQKNLLPLSSIVIEKCVNEINKILNKAEPITDGKTNSSYHFAEFKEAIEEDLKRQKMQKINKYIIYIGLALSLIFLILSSPKVGIIQLSPRS